jgi:Uma2 family endonuclease
MITQKQRYSLDEFHAFCELPQNRARLFELINGEIVEKQSNFTASKLAVRIGHPIGSFLDTYSIGNITGADGSYILAPVYEVMPDVGYISLARLPHDPPREVQAPPDLAVEVKSPTDSKRDMRQKAEDYLRFGTQMVWLVFPDDLEVEVYVPDKDVQTVRMDGILDGGVVLPGFTLAVREIFK